MTARHNKRRRPEAPAQPAVPAEARPAKQRRPGERLLNLLQATAPIEPDDAPAPRRRGRASKEKRR